MMFHHCNTTAPPIYLRATVLLFIHKKERLHTQQTNTVTVHNEMLFGIRQTVKRQTGQRLLNLLISQCAAYLSIIVHLCMYSVCTMLGDRNTCTFLRIHSCASTTLDGG